MFGVANNDRLEDRVTRPFVNDNTDNNDLYRKSIARDTYNENNLILDYGCLGVNNHHICCYDSCQLEH